MSAIGGVTISLGYDVFMSDRDQAAPLAPLKFVAPPRGV